MAKDYGMKGMTDKEHDQEKRPEGQNAIHQLNNEGYTAAKSNV